MNKGSRKQLNIIAKKIGPANIYIGSAKLNAKNIDRSGFTQNK